MGMAGCFAAVDARTLADALVDASRLRSRDAPEAMEAAGIYPERIRVRDGDEAQDYLLEHQGKSG